MRRIALIAACVLLCAAPASRAAQRRLNIVIITIDAVRADRLSCYGYPQETSPSIDSLAARGIVFERAISQATWTWPSLNSLQTCDYPMDHGAYFWDRKVPEGLWTLPGAAGKRGYATAFFANHGGLGPLNPDFGNVRDDPELDAAAMTGLAIDWLGKTEGPFVLWIHYFDTHDTSIGVPERKHFGKNVTRRDIALYSAKYDRAIRAVDAQIGRLVRTLQAQGRGEDTVIVVMSDHGEENLEHGIFFSHGGFLWDTLLHVPGVAVLPGVRPRRIAALVQSIDIMATACAFAGITPDPGCDGKDLLPLIEGTGAAGGMAFSEHKEFGDADGKWVYTLRSLMSGDWKIICREDSRGSSYALYDLRSDPRERHDLAGKEPAVLERMKGMYSRIAERGAGTGVAVTPVDEQRKERLRNLGYLQ